MLPMPMRNYRWAEKSQIVMYQHFFDMRKKELKQGKKITQWKDFFDEAKIGHFFRCDLKYPKEIHKEHGDFPLVSFFIFKKNILKIC